MIDLVFSGLNGMCVGEKRRLRIPAELGYGAAGAGAKVRSLFVASFFFFSYDDFLRFLRTLLSSLKWSFCKSNKKLFELSKEKYSAWLRVDLFAKKKTKIFFLVFVFTSMASCLLHRDIAAYLLTFVSDRKTFSLVCSCWNRVWRASVQRLSSGGSRCITEQLLAPERFPALRSLVIKNEIFTSAALNVIGETFGSRLTHLWVKVVNGASTKSLNLEKFVALRGFQAGVTFCTLDSFGWDRNEVELIFSSSVRLQSLSLLNMYTAACISTPILSKKNLPVLSQLKYLAVSSSDELSCFRGRSFPCLETLDVIPQQSFGSFSNHVISQIFQKFSPKERDEVFPALRKLRVDCCAIPLIAKGLEIPHGVVEMHLQHEPLLRGADPLQNTIIEILALKKYAPPSLKTYLYYNRNISSEDVAQAFAKADSSNIEFRSTKWPTKAMEQGSNSHVPSMDIN